MVDKDVKVKELIINLMQNCVIFKILSITVLYKLGLLTPLKAIKDSQTSRYS